MNLRQRILLAGVIGIIAAALLGTIGFVGERSLASAMHANELSMNALRNHMDGDMMHDALRADVINALLKAKTGDSGGRAEVEADFKEHSERFLNALAKNNKLDLPDDIKKALSSIRPALDAYISSARDMISLAFTDAAQAQEKFASFSSAFSELEELQENVSTRIEGTIKTNGEDSEAAISRSLWMLSISLVAVIALLLIINTNLQRAILIPIEQTIALAHTLAGGNLRTAIAVNRDDEVGELQKALANMQNNLRTMIENMHKEAEQLRGVSTTLKNTANTVVHSSTEQADSANTMAAAMEQMMRNIETIAQHAQNAKDISSQSEVQANQGSTVILGVVEGMNAIAHAVNESSNTIVALGKSSEEIYSIIQVIKSIADQTNLLALNAAIEAARAGDAGRGFAVVADEVRNLAARTAQSTQEITEMIGRIQSTTKEAVNSMETGVERVRDGVDRAERAGVAIDAIRAGAQRAASVVEEISQNISEQSKASAEVAHRVEHIAKMSRAANDAVQGLAGTSAHLADISGEMHSAVGRFQT